MHEARARARAREVALALALALGTSGCGRDNSAQRAERTTSPDTTRARASAVFFKMLSGTVKNGDAVHPPCPVTPHFDAVLTVSRVHGTLRYRWERSTGDSSKTRELELPAAADTGSADLTLAADEWQHEERAIQKELGDRVHVLSPIDRKSDVITVSARCY